MQPVQSERFLFLLLAEWRSRFPAGVLNECGPVTSLNHSYVCVRARASHSIVLFC